MAWAEPRCVGGGERLMSVNSGVTDMPRRVLAACGPANWVAAAGGVVTHVTGRGRDGGGSSRF